MKRFLSLILLFFLVGACSAKNTVTDYQRIFTPVYTADGKLMIALRVLKMNDIPSFLTVDPESLQTQVLPIAQFKSRNTQKQDKEGAVHSWTIESTRYYQLLNKSTSAPYHVQDQGIRHASQAIQGVLI